MANKRAGTQQALVIDQWAGGLNTYSDPSSISDNELADCVNLEVSLDGSLVSRPPFASIDNGTTIGFTQRINIIGTAYINATSYTFGTNVGGTYRWSSGAWTLVTTVICRGMVQYNDAVYLLTIPDSATTALGKWTPSGGYVDISPANLKTMMGASYGGDKLLIYKDRLFIVPGFAKTVNQNRLIFSDPGNPEGYSTTTQFVDVNPGDGERLLEAIVMDDNLVLFKSHSSYVFTFTSTPADAELVRISNTIGAQFIKCVVPYENSAFVLHNGQVYEIVNYNFQRINTKVPFVVDTSAPSARLHNTYLCRVGDRLVVRYYNRVYVYGLKTQTWSRWWSQNADLNNLGYIEQVRDGTSIYYLAGSCVTADTRLYRIFDGFFSNVKENAGGTDVEIQCSITTKKFNINDPFHFKRLAWWGADMMGMRDITGIVTTTVPLFSPTWGDIMDQDTIWNDFGLWGQSDSSTLSEYTITVTSSNILRSFFRFPKSLRFRQASFVISTTTDGSSLTGPVRIFGITIVSSHKELVPKGIN